MKEYRVEKIKYGTNQGKNLAKMEELLNENASEGWELKWIEGTFFILEREK